VGPIVLLSCLALLAGPLTARLHSKTIGHGLDAFVLVTVVGLVFLHAVPQSFGHLGLWAGALAIGGVVLAWLHDRREGMPSASTGPLSRTVVVLMTVSAGIHALLDGAALVGDQHGAGALAVSVVLHRIPVGIALWSVLRPRAGLLVTLLVAAALVVGTAIGAAGADLLVGRFAHGLFAGQAVFIGALLYTVLMTPVARPAGIPQATNERMAQVLGAGAGAAVVVSLGMLHGETEALQALWLITLDSAMPVLVAFLVVGLMQAAARDVSPPTVTGSPLFQAAVGAAVGLPTPLCSCSVVPLYRDLVGRGVPPPTAMAFLVAAPEVGVPAVLLSLSLLGPEVTAFRTVGAFLLAVVVGAIVGARVPARSAPTMVVVRPTMRDWRAMARRFVEGTLDAVDHTGPWILLGLLVAAVASPMLQADVLARVPAGLDVVAAAVVGVPLYVCASGSTPVAATLLLQGVSPGAVIAFLWTGPATNLTTLGLIGRLHGPRVAALFAATMATVAIALGLLANGLGLDIDHRVGADADAGVVDVVGFVGVLVLSLLVIVSVWRQGVAGALIQLSPTPPDGLCPVHGDRCAGHGHALSPVAPSPPAEVAVAVATFSAARQRPSMLRPR